MKKIEFVKPILHIDKFFKVADYLIQSDVDELVELGRTMRNAYENQMMESEKKEDLPSDLPQDRIKQWQNPAECKTGVCD